MCAVHNAALQDSLQNAESSNAKRVDYMLLGLSREEKNTPIRYSPIKRRA